MTTSLLDVQPGVGAQLPRVTTVPKYVSTTGDEAIELASMAGLELDPWQQHVLVNALGERPDGKWAAFEVGVMVSRQNGKGGLLEARQLAGLFLLNERLIIHSAHMFDTSIEAFGRLTALIENTPTLSKRVRKILNSHGQEGVELKNGQRIRFRTRTKGGGRGFTADCLILDEAMDIPEATHAALLPTLSARPNPQVWYTGSAVDQEVDDNGIVFARVRERGTGTESTSLAYFEWSAPLDIHDISVEETHDHANWAFANPALGIRITAEHIGHERASFMTRKFAVERLGVGDWPDTTDGALKIIPPEVWAALIDPQSQPSGRICFAFDVSPDQAWGSIAAAGIRKDGKLHVEIVDHRRGTGWMPERIAELMKRNPNRGIWCDPAGPAGSLLADLRGFRLEPVVVGTKEHGQACGLFMASIRDDKLRHIGTDELVQAVDGAAKRNVGDAWLWDRKSSHIDISPLVAVTLATWGAQSTRKRVGGARVVDLAAIARQSLVTT